MNIDEELMTILMEECAEVQQIASKVMRFGWDSVHPEGGDDNRTRLAKEIGDLTQMIDILHEYDIISYVEIEEYSSKKRDKLKIFSNLLPE